MGTLDISWLNLFVGLCLLIIPIGFLWKYRTGLVGSVFLSTFRMVIQLSFIGFYLKYLFLWNNFWINLLWVFIMALAASETAVTRVNLKTSILWLPTLIGFLTGAVLVGSYFLLLVLGPNELKNAR
ncbi:MAG: ABC transporter permease, partial [Bacteroidaceae bacterium]